MPPSDLAEAPAAIAAYRSTPALQHEIEQFYYLEAELLDDRRFHDWLGLLAADLHYWMPVRATLQRREGAGEFEDERGAAYFDDIKPTMEMRIRKLLQPSAWAEDPPSRTRHAVSNVRIGADDGASLSVKSQFIVYQTRAERRADLFVGEREDVLRRTDHAAGFEIVRRRILIDQTTLLAPLLTSFF